MKKKIESHPDAQSRKEMLQQMHLRAGQKLQPANGQFKSPQRADEKRSTEPPKT